MQKQHLFSLLIALVVLLAAGGLAELAEAKGGPGITWYDFEQEYDPAKGVDHSQGVAGSVTYTEQLDLALAYAWNRWTLYSNAPSCFSNPQNFSSDTCWSGWAGAATNITITIGYDARIYDLVTGQTIASGATVLPGQQVLLEFTPLSSDNVYWFATGYSLDSPYGEWREDAAPPAREYSNNGGVAANHVTCLPRDYTSTALVGDANNPYDNSIYEFDVYNALVMNPPERDIDPEALTGCGYIGDGEEYHAWTCTVSGTGTITPTFNFGPTYGYFYYRYYDTRNMNYGGGYGNYGGPGCYGNNIPLRVVNDGLVENPNSNFYSGSGMTDAEVSSDPYVFNVPEQYISYPLTVGIIGAAPTVPVIDGPVTGTPNTNYTFSFTSTDPDGDTLRYGIDWNNDDTLDQWIPASDYVASGVEQSSQKQWATIGAKTFQALAQDSAGNSSGWATHTITIAEIPPPPSISCTVNGSSLPISVNTEEPVTYVATPTGATGAPYAWSVTPDEGASFGTSNTAIATYTTPGAKSMQVTGSGNVTKICPLVTVAGLCPAPNEVTLTAAPNRVKEGGTTTLTLSGTGIVTSCTVTGPGVNQTVAAAACTVPETSIPTGAITTQTTYTVSCDSGAITDIAIVNVVPNFEEF